MAKYRQYKLKTRGKDSVLVCWLESDAKLSIGTNLTLKEMPSVWWSIVEAYEAQIDTPPFTKWQVGGLT